MITIGIIDDDEDSNLIIAALLEDQYKVIAFQQWQEALHAFEKDLPDLLLLDISMPDIDGYAVLKHIREKPSLKDLRVVALTAYALPEDNPEFIKKGFDGVIAKPITDKTILIHVIQKILKT